MSKKLLIDAMTGGTGFATKREAEHAVGIVTDTIVKLAEAGERVHIRGFGGFQMKDRKGRTGMLGGRPVEIPARRALVFTDKRS